METPEFYELATLQNSIFIHFEERREYFAPNTQRWLICENNDKEDLRMKVIKIKNIYKKSYRVYLINIGWATFYVNGSKKIHYCSLDCSSLLYNYTNRFETVNLTPSQFVEMLPFREGLEQSWCDMCNIRNSYFDVIESNDKISHLCKYCHKDIKMYVDQHHNQILSMNINNQFPWIYRPEIKYSGFFETSRFFSPTVEGKYMIIKYNRDQ